ncbi:hypothetical protein POTOM_037863 [Populus tomentosa]|uniref:Uncharacterized protein n=1 Tax=Populus tomentosa TaxID=118781 RepID=A0A8X7YY79_POPTO|nr:hypothetical protein POTOM_037863 [Populus tomentosa]
MEVLESKKTHHRQELGSVSVEDQLSISSKDHVTVKESVVDVLSEISKYCDIYLMERTLDDESGKLADIGFTFQPLDQVERINFKKYELEALFSLKRDKMEWRFRELLRGSEFFGLNRRKVVAMIQGCKIRPVGLVRTTMDTRCLWGCLGGTWWLLDTGSGFCARGNIPGLSVVADGFGWGVVGGSGGLVEEKVDSVIIGHGDGGGCVWCVGGGVKSGAVVLLQSGKFSNRKLEVEK